MGLSEFLSSLPESGSAPLSHSLLSELSGITQAEADELALIWEEWRPERLRSLFERLASLVEDDTTLEFEVVFKSGLVAPDPEVRRLAIAGLAESTDRTLAERLAEALEADTDARVRAAAAAGMSTLCSLAAQGKLQRLDAERMRRALVRALSQPSEEAEVRRRALETVAVFGGEKVALWIADAYASPDPRVRQSAVFAMGRTSSPRWLKQVTAELDAPEPAVRYEAVVALGEIGEEEHAALLRGPLDDSDLAVQLASVGSLEKLGGDLAKKLLRQAADSPEPAVADAAREALEVVEAEGGLEDVIGPEMQRLGGMYGGPAGTIPSDDSEGYDAPEREGWGRLLEPALGNGHSHGSDDDGEQPGADEGDE